MVNRNGRGLVVVGGKLIVPKATKAQTLKASAQGLAAKLLAMQKRIEMQEMIVGALMNACLDAGLDPELLAEKGKEAGIVIQVVQTEEQAENGEEDQPKPEPGEPSP